MVCGLALTGARWYFRGTMRILMLTNTYLPHVGGVARSVERTRQALMARGHQVCIIAPEFSGSEKQAEEGVIRVPALQNFNGSDFSVRLPILGQLDAPIEAFAPDLLHAHHPFLLGDTAVRLASDRRLPLVFTHHTLYEQYTHYVGGRSPALKRFAAQLSTEFANLCDHVIAPSESLQRLIRRRGVKSPIAVVPTGLERESYDKPAEKGLRQAWELPENAFVVGHIGRLAAEKNLGFLGQALARFLHKNEKAYALIAGQGPLEARLKRRFALVGVADRVRFAGVLGGADLTRAYASMDLFAFASRSETQGMVLAEAMAMGTPVIALNAPGARDIVRDGVNGLLLPRQHVDAFAAAMETFAGLSPTKRASYRREAEATAEGLALGHTIPKLEAVYQAAVSGYRARTPEEQGGFQQFLSRLQAEWNLFAAKASAVGSAIAG